ncbi:MAG: hypothetical protein GC150_04400 [Rhizobiales bacterium]|nr:hypothetical protein [Hyphomicrobiales bacterium]
MIIAGIAGSRQAVHRNLLALAIAAVGGLAAEHLGLVAGLLSGAMFLVAVAALSGVPIEVSGRVRYVAFVAIGIVLGSTVTEETIASVPRWPASIAALAASVVVVMLILPRYLMRRAGLDETTARLCAIPGALSFVLALSIDLGADTRRVAVMHTLRVTLLLLFIPAAVQLWLGHVPVPMVPHTTLGLGELAGLFAVSVIATEIAKRFGMPSPSFTMPLFVAAAACGSGLLHGGVPAWIVWPALIATGAAVGARFIGMTVAFLLESLRLAMAGFAISVGTSIAFAVAASELLGLPLVQLLLAFAPGGLDAMTVLAFMLGVDPAFVATHQLIRFLGLAMAVPFLFRREARIERAGPPGE